MIYIITGESYQCHKKLNEIKEKYKNYKYNSISILDSGIKQLYNIIREQDLFNNKKIIIVRDWKEVELKEILKNIKDVLDNIIIFYAPGIKLRLKLKNMEIIDYKFPKEQELIKFIKNELKKRGIDNNESLKIFFSKAEFYFIGKITDSKFQSLWPLINEIEKFSLANANYIDLLWSIEDDVDPFALTNAMALKDYKKTLLLIERQIYKKDNPISIISRIMWQLRTLILAPENPKDFHPFVVQKARSSIRNFKQGEISYLYKKAVLLYENIILQPSFLKFFYLEKFFWEEIS